MRYCARRRIRRAIREHELKREAIMYARGMPGDTISWTTFVEHQDELWHRAACEYHCAERLKKLLQKYK